MVTRVVLAAVPQFCSAHCRLLAAVPQFRSAHCRFLATVAAGPAPPTQASEEWLRARPFEEMPGPDPLPVIGNMWRFLPKIGDLFFEDQADMMKHLRKRYGDIVRFEGIPGKPTMVFLMNPDYIEKAYRSEGAWPERPGLDSSDYYRRNTRKEWFEGHLGLATTQGKEWHDFRRQVNQAMMQPRSAKLYVGPIDQVASDFVNRMAQLRDNKQEMPDDFINELYKWALESVCLVALDARLGCLEPNLSADSEPQRMIDAVQVIFDCLYRLDLRLSMWKLFSTRTWRRFVAVQDFLYGLTMQHINAAMERIKAKSHKSSGELSVLERLLLSNDDPGVACVMALDMIGAGIDTTSNASVVALHYLCKYPETQERLFEELYSQLQESQMQPLTPAKLEECKYLKACVKESMRMMPITLGNARRCNVDNLVLGNYRIPKGMDLIMFHPYLSASEEQFPRADQFRPERWLKGPDNTFEAQSSHPFASMPFGFGPRMCVGRRFAELEVLTLVARIIRRFRLEFHGDLKWKIDLIRVAASPLKFKVIDRDR